MDREGDGDFVPCAQIVRDGDRDRYLTALFAPPVLRQRLFALYAFNVEMARVAEVVSEPMLGEIRLQWWRESLDAIYGTGIDGATLRRHDITPALACVIADADLPRVTFDRMIDARVHDLEDAPFETVTSLEQYLRETGGGLMELAIRALCPPGLVPEQGAIDDIAASGAVAYGLPGLVRAIGYHAAQGRCMMPRDMMEAGGLDPHDFLHRRMTEPLGDLVRDLCDRADAALRRFEGVARSLPRAAIPACLPVVLARSDIGLLRKSGYDPFRLEGHPGLGRLTHLILSGLMKRV